MDCRVAVCMGVGPYAKEDMKGGPYQDQDKGEQLRKTTFTTLLQEHAMAARWAAPRFVAFLKDPANEPFVAREFTDIKVAENAPQVCSKDNMSDDDNGGMSIVFICLSCILQLLMTLDLKEGCKPRALEPTGWSVCR